MGGRARTNPCRGENNMTSPSPAPPDSVSFEAPFAGNPLAHVLVVERRFRETETGTEIPSTTNRIRAIQPQTEVSVAYSGWEALEILRHGPIRFDFVVIDANVGWMDPVDFIRRAQSVDPVM